VREPLTAERLRVFARALARSSEGPARVYMTGGSTAVLYGWRATTRDLDLRFEPDRDELLRAIARLKDELKLNVELASPLDFIPVADDWQERSVHAFTEGALSFFHFDLVAQALSKAVRGLPRDLEDVQALLRRSLVTLDDLRDYLTLVEPSLYRYPQLDPAAVRAAVETLSASG
jgi:hypothetical protein